MSPHIRTLKGCNRAGQGDPCQATLKVTPWTTLKLIPLLTFVEVGLWTRTR
jgi:hypothetical protein